MSKKSTGRYGLINLPSKESYYTALGRFTDTFASVEMFMTFSLWHYAKTKLSIARSVFSGVRVKEAMAHIKRIIESTNADLEIREDAEFIFKQLADITGARNDIMHFGTTDLPSGITTVTNALKATAEDRITAFVISPKILDEMTNDLEKIIIHLRQRHVGRPALRAKYVQEILLSPWRYKHRVQQRPKRMERGKSHPPHKRGPKQPPQP